MEDNVTHSQHSIGLIMKRQQFRGCSRHGDLIARNNCCSHLRQSPGCFTASARADALEIEHGSMGTPLRKALAQTGALSVAGRAALSDVQEPKAELLQTASWNTSFRTEATSIHFGSVQKLCIL
jgi:hypothetical protein